MLFASLSPVGDTRGALAYGRWPYGARNLWDYSASENSDNKIRGRCYL